MKKKIFRERERETSAGSSRHTQKSFEKLSLNSFHWTQSERECGEGVGGCVIVWALSVLNATKKLSVSTQFSQSQKAFMKLFFSILFIQGFLSTRQVSFIFFLTIFLLCMKSAAWTTTTWHSRRDSIDTCKRTTIFWEKSSRDRRSIARKRRWKFVRRHRKLLRLRPMLMAVCSRGRWTESARRQLWRSLANWQIQRKFRRW